MEHELTGEDQNGEAGLATLAGVAVGIPGDVPDDALLDAAALARAFAVCRKSIFRARDRGELPEPFTFGGRLCWTAGAVRDHLRCMQADAIREAERRETRRAADFA